ncbi:hypothetical protein VOM14_26840 [Paraburkholderia sp. MPAMCS5]|uniref:hypothetical protein n=1 Tax=Paraburkholderia sp. MPAMCS5 TaxID=3112563 RepID=UPI002E19CE87|nr:hypothetical protein [Paraburkholderia sp. MPAMCS5]
MQGALKHTSAARPLRTLTGGARPKVVVIAALRNQARFVFGSFGIALKCAQHIARKVFGDVPPLGRVHWEASETALAAGAPYCTDSQRKGLRLRKQHGPRKEMG